MDWKIFFLRAAVALALGALVGAERQLRQRLARLRTNALVSTGAALFVMVSLLTSNGDTSSAARIAAQVVSGIGFLGAGVIMREGLNVRGLNTAATLWCSAAIGTLVAPCANILLREAAQCINRQGAAAAVEVDQRFTFNIVCRAEDEVHVRTLVLHGLNGSALRLQSLHSEDLATPDKLEVRAELVGSPASPAQLEQLASRVSLEKGVSSVRWQLLGSNHQDE